MQRLRVEVGSFLPHGQSDGGDLAGPCQTGHGRPHPLGNSCKIKILQRARTCAGRDGRSFEQILQVVIGIVIQTSHRDGFAVALQFAANPAVLTAVVRFHGETAVGPQLALAPKTMRCLQQCHQQGRPNRPQRRNLAKQRDGIGCGWLVDREADRLLHKFNRLESRQNLSSLLQEEAWGISGAEEIQLKAWSAQSLIVVLLVLGVDIHRNSQGSPRA